MFSQAITVDEVTTTAKLIEYTGIHDGLWAETREESVNGILPSWMKYILQFKREETEGSDSLVKSCCATLPT